MPFRAAIDIMFRGPMGVDAIYTPKGGAPWPESVRVIIEQPDVMTPIYDLPVVSDSTQVEVRTSEVPGLVEGDALMLTDGAVLTISAKPKRDATRLIWIAQAVES